MPVILALLISLILVKMIRSQDFRKCYGLLIVIIMPKEALK